jgi:RNA polymerase sigma-70 factor, ECF subfamily
LVLIVIEPQAEGALIRAAQTGDRAAFGRLYERYGTLVHGILIARVPYDEAEDLMQDVFVKAMQQIATLREPQAFSGWLIAIARRIATDHCRSMRLRRFVGLAPERGPKCQPEPLAILATIRQLPKSYRETLILRLVEGMTGPEIAARTGLTPDSVRVNLCRGMKILRESLKSAKRKYEEPDDE